MGTRHLICVVKDGDYRVAQYGQWDGYPGGQGVDILNFLTKEMDREVFESKLGLLSWATDAELHQQWEECGADGSDLVSVDIDGVHNTLYPENSRDTGAGILSIIQNLDRPSKLVNQLEFAGDSLFCEWAYVIDLDKNTLEVYEGFNKKRNDILLKELERFSKFLKTEGEYDPVKLAKSFKLDNLPSGEEFVAAFSKDEAED